MRRRGRGFVAIVLLSVTGLVAAGLAFAALLYFQISRDLPAIASVEDYKPPGVTVVHATDGVLGEFYKERREIVPYEKMPKRMIEAFLSAEDDDFFQHGGINFHAILRAGIANFLAGQVVQGGSTITQQLAKSLYLTPDRNLIRKAKEAILAYRLEKNLSKEQILYLYLNQIYLGNGAYGIQAASRAFFRKDVQALSIAEIALLAGMPRAPSKYNPLTNPSRAKERQLYVLRRMAENGYITGEVSRAEGKRSLRIYPAFEETRTAAQYYLEHIRKMLVQKYGEKAVYEEGLQVRTPATIRVLEAAQRALIAGLSQVERKKGFKGPIRHVESIEERAKYLLEEGQKIERKRIPYSTLTPEGTISDQAARQDAGLSRPEKFLTIGETYEALVEAAPETAKPVEVAIGKARAKIAWADLAWTQAKAPAKILKPGNVVRVRVLRASEREGVWASLDPEPEVQGAFFAMNSRSGEVFALIGGSDFTKSEFNRATQARRQVGSLIKPLLYSLAIERGYTPASILVDSPLVFDNEEAGTWKPSNYEQKFFGDTTLWQALVNSRNVPTVKLVQALGVEEATRFLRRLRLTGEIPADLSISLGSPTFTLEELVRTYALFPRHGKAVRPVYFLEVKDRSGKPAQELEAEAAPEASPSPTVPSPTAIAESAPETPESEKEDSLTPDGSDPDQLLDRRVAGVMGNLLHDAVLYGTGARAKELGRWIGGKTGTSNEFRDAWFVGFTPAVVAGAWVGHDDFKTLGTGEAGGAAALPIWIETMKEALSGVPPEEFSTPAGVVFANVHPKKGVLVDARSSQGVRMPFVEGTEPTEEAPKGKTSASPSTSGSDFLKDDLGE